MNLVLKNLDFQKCFKYLSLEYSEGLFFSERLINESYLIGGSFFTVVPDNVKDENLYDFQWGGRIYPFYRPPGVTVMRVRNDSKKIINSSLFGYVQLSNTNFIGMEDYSSDPSSQNVRNSKLKYYILNNNKLFYLLDQKYTSEDFFEHYAIVAHRYLSLCLLLRLKPDFTNALPSNILDEQTTELIFQGINSFFISVYDGEGYLIWSSKEQNDFLKLISCQLAIS